MSDRDTLVQAINELAVVRGRVTLASGREADYYVDMRRITLNGYVAPIIGRVMRQLTADWDYEAVGGLTMGADPVATAMMHSAAVDSRCLHAFVVRKAAKEHGLQRTIEGPDVAGRRVLLVEDTSTTGGSLAQALEAVRAAGGVPVGVAVVVDRATGAKEAIEALGLEYRYAVGVEDLSV
ncbi:MAG: orotate phosphoribosyltransferase [Propionibacteriaceae bacterium]|jgi:orotate phosphoribosyltransferase|nr:orotate phosphoribosyltransferase [Propionibacteriaceae bacterium]